MKFKRKRNLSEDTERIKESKKEKSDKFERRVRKRK